MMIGHCGVALSSGATVAFNRRWYPDGKRVKSRQSTGRNRLAATAWPPPPGRHRPATTARPPPPDPNHRPDKFEPESSVKAHQSAPTNSVPDTVKFHQKVWYLFIYVCLRVFFSLDFFFVWVEMFKWNHDKCPTRKLFKSDNNGRLETSKASTEKNFWFSSELKCVLKETPRTDSENNWNSGKNHGKIHFQNWCEYKHFFKIKIIKNDESIQKSGNVENAKLASFQMDK